MRSGKRRFSGKAVKLCCLALAVLMVLGTLVGTIALSVNASYYDPNLRVRAGLVYGDNVAPSFNFNAATGFTVGVTKGDRRYEPMLTFNNVRNAVVLLEQNYTNLSNIYTPAASSVVTVGNFHLEEATVYTNASDAQARLNDISNLVPDSYIAYVDSVFKIRIGSYASYAEAEAALPTFFTGYQLYVTQGRGTGTVLVNTDTGKILFSADCAGQPLSVEALSVQGHNSYLKTIAGSLYDGVFEFKKYENGIAVVNLLDLDEYVLGVLPWEIYPTWPAETIKAFAVAMRTFAVYHYGTRHNSAYGFDVCTTSHCQNYKGMTRSYQSMAAAVSATSGEIATYNGKAIMSIYCGTNGGVTEDVRDIWGSSVYYPYLTSVTIPLEQESCVDQPNGVWTSEATPKELSDYFVNSSSSAAVKVLTAPILELNVLQRSKYSGVYIYELEIIDTEGHRAVIKTSSAVRSALIKYCDSAYVDISYNYLFNVQTASFLYTEKMNNLKTSVITANGEATLENDSPKTLTVLTADGEKKLSSDGYTIFFDGKGNGHGGGMSMYGAVDLAKAGYSYDRILKTYYPGIEIIGIGSPDGDGGGTPGTVTPTEPTVPVAPGTFEGCFDKVVTTANLNLRTSPSTSAPVQCVVPSGTVLYRTGRGGDGWDRVLSPDGFTCYVSKDYIKPAP